MLTAALIHRSSGAHAYPLDGNHLRVMLQAARGDLQRVICIHNDRFRDAASDQSVELIRAGHDDQYDYWVGTLAAPTRRAKYRFRLHGGADSVWLGERGVFQDADDCAPFHYSYINPADEFRLPGWLSGSVVYEIFCDRFARGNPDATPDGAEPWGTKPTWYNKMGGDLAGIRRRLDWVRELGVGCLYLTPIFASPSCHRYDTRDYYTVEPMLGTEADLQALVQSAHDQGIRLLLDGVFNHSGQEFFAFQDVIAKGLASPYWHWFNVGDDQVQIGPGLMCNYESFAENVPTLPKLMTQHPDVAEYLLQVGEHWVRQANIDGWRLDVSNEVDHRFWREFRRRVRAANPEAFILGEVWVDALTWLQGDQYDSVMHYPWLEAVVGYLTDKLSGAAFDAALTRLRFAYPGFVTGGLLHLLSSHDVPRILTSVGGNRVRAAMAALLLLTAQGVPMVYYGDEIGLEGSWDPENRACMAWDPEQQDQSLLGLYRQLGHLRQALPWLNIGGWETLEADPKGGLLVYRRSGELALNAAPAGLTAGEADEAIWVLINPDQRPQTVTLHDLPAGAVDLLGTGYPLLASQLVRMGPDSYRLIGSPAVRAKLYPSRT